MRCLNLRVLSLLVVAALPVAGCAAKQAPPAKYRIAVIPKGVTHDFWRSIHAGARHAAAERGDTRILWEGPSKEDQRQEQQNIVERFISDRVSAIVLAPCDRQTLVAPVEAAVRHNIPIVIIDSGLQLSDAIAQSDQYLGYIATDNRQGGARAAQRMVELLKGKSRAKVLMLRYQAGSESTEQREAGFEQEIRQAAAIDFLIAPGEAGATADSAQKEAERLLSDDKYKDVDGIFTPNESSTAGMLQALRGLKRAGDLKLVGFDSSEILLHALRAGELHGLVMQDPFDMGYQGVLRALDHLTGKPLPKNRTRHTNLQVATKENLELPEIRSLYARDLAPFLK